MTRAISSESADDMVKALPDLFEQSMFSLFMTTILATERLDIPAATGERVLLINEDTRDDHQGAVWIGFPGRAKLFGQSMQHEAVRSRTMPFVELVARQDLRLKDVLKNAQDIGDTEARTLSSAESDLRGILERKSRWSFGMHFVNMSSSPIVIPRAVTAEIRQRSTKFLVRPGAGCYLVSAEVGDGIQYADVLCPTVVKGHSDITVGFITRDVQERMKYGSQIRSAFDEGSAQFRLICNLTRPGIRKSQIVRTKWFPFRTIDATEQFSET